MPSGWGSPNHRQSRRARRPTRSDGALPCSLSQCAPARIPGEGGERLDDLPADAETIVPPCSTRSTAAAGRSRGKAGGTPFSRSHPPQALIATLARAVLREDAASTPIRCWRRCPQFTAWATRRGPAHLIAVVRYLAAHSPTERAALQTADIARRLMRGGELHQEAGHRDDAAEACVSYGSPPPA